MIVMIILQSGLRSSHNCHWEDVAASDSDNCLRFYVINESTNIASRITILHQFINIRNSQPDDLWKICKLIDIKTVNDVEHFWVN